MHQHDWNKPKEITFLATRQTQINASEIHPFPGLVVFLRHEEGIQSLAKRDLSLLSSQENAFAICISELLSCPSMLRVCCLKCVMETRDCCSQADVGLSPTNMDYVKVGSELTRIC